MKKTKCNKCGKFKFCWQFHWRILNIQRMEVCKTCRNKVNQENKMNSIDKQMQNVNNLMSAPAEEVIPFGKYKGWSVEDVPNYYLNWMLEDNVLEEKKQFIYLLKPIEEEVKYRNQYRIFIEGE